MNSFWPVLVFGIIAYRGFKGNYNAIALYSFDVSIIAYRGFKGNYNRYPRIARGRKIIAYRGFKGNYNPCQELYPAAANYSIPGI